MESFVEFFHFSTAIPFGYALFALIWLGLTGIGLVGLVVAIFWREVRRPILAFSAIP